jgi:hypothetical protein
MPDNLAARLRALTRYDVGRRGPNAVVELPDDDGPYVRHDDLVAALVATEGDIAAAQEALKPTASIPAASGAFTPAHRRAIALLRALGFEVRDGEYS